MTYRQTLITCAFLFVFEGCTGQLGDIEEDAQTTEDAAPTENATPARNVPPSSATVPSNSTTPTETPEARTDAGARATPDVRVTPAPMNAPDASVTPDASAAPDVRVTPDAAATPDAAVRDVAVTRDAAPATAPAQTYPGAPGVSPTLGGCAVFPPDNPWNRDISAAPLSANSAAVIRNIQAHGDQVLRADFGSNPDYGIPITIVPTSQMNVPVRITEYADESDPGPLPIPAMPRVEPGNDHHMLLVHQGTCMLYELYHARRDSTGWSAGSIAAFDLRSNAIRPQGWTSADQAGLPIAPGLARVDEVNSGAIRHALRVTFTHTRAAWAYPATHPGGESDVNAPFMGMRMRLRADYDTSRLTGQARVIAEALKRYGMFVADTGTNWFVSGDSDTRWNDDDLVTLRTIPGTAFEVIETGALRTR